MCILKLLPLQGALLTDLIPRAMPWAKSFCPFRACWVISIIQEGVLGFMAFLQLLRSLISMRSHTAKCSSAAGEDL